IDACAALAAFRGGEHDLAVALLMPLSYALQRIGGSHAQRDLFAQTLIAAALKIGRFPLARALTAERSALKPASPHSWSLYARALDGLGDTAVANAARAKAKALLDA
ncbi:MAG: tetratricopeptide repeat protein, partial [Alphaproteobacteria bacterium]